MTLAASPPAGLDSRILYLVLIGVVASERLVELFVAARNRRRLLARGGVEAGAGHYPVMVLLHSTLLVAAPAEVFLLDRPFVPWLAAGCLGLVALTMGLRYWVISTLAGRWTTRVITLPGEPLVVAGPYRFMRHPNYLAVVLEILALPLVHGAWLTAVAYTLANAALLSVRIRVEDRALLSSTLP